MVNSLLAVILNVLIKASGQQGAPGFPKEPQVGVLLKLTTGEAVRVNLSKRADILSVAERASIDNYLLDLAVSRTARVLDIRPVIPGAFTHRGLHGERTLAGADGPIRHLAVQPRRAGSVDDPTVSDVRAAVGFHLKRERDRGLAYGGGLGGSGARTGLRLHSDGFSADRLTILIQSSYLDLDRTGIAQRRTADGVGRARSLLVIHQHLTDGRVLDVDLILVSPGDGRPTHLKIRVGTNRGSGGRTQGQLRSGAGSQRGGHDTQEHEHNEQQGEHTLHNIIPLSYSTDWNWLSEWSVGSDHLIMGAARMNTSLTISFPVFVLGFKQMNQLERSIQA